MRGQDNLRRLLIAFLCDGRVLVEGVPRPGKTLAIKSLSALLGADFQRIQFTAELHGFSLVSAGRKRLEVLAKFRDCGMKELFSRGHRGECRI